MVAYNGQNIHIDVPLFATLLVSIRVIYIVYIVRGSILALISALLTLICISPLFINFSIVDIITRAYQRVIPPTTTPTTQRIEDNNNISSSQIYTEATTEELNDMRNQDHSAFGRFVHQGIETWSEDIEELVYVARVLRDNQGLMILLIGGISSMVMAIVAGLDDVHVMRALLLSITCYGITTILVARSARRIVNQHIASQNGDRKKLSCADVNKIVQAIPEEKFVSNDELENCDISCIESMLRCRQIAVPQKTDNENDIDTTEDNEQRRRYLAKELIQHRNYNDTCCICLSQFVKEERIRVLPSCKHEFHSHCISQWAKTFASKGRSSFCYSKRGIPTCPLCVQEVQSCVSCDDS